MWKFTFSRDPLNYVYSQESGLVYNPVEPDRSFMLPQKIPVEIEELGELINRIKGGSTVFVPFAEKAFKDERFFSLLLTSYEDIMKAPGKMVFVSNSIKIPQEIEQYLVFEEEPPVTEEEIKKTLLEAFESFKGFTPEPSQMQKIENAARKVRGLSKTEVLNAARLSFDTYGDLNEEFLSKFKLASIKKKSILDYEEPNVKPEHLGGCDVLKRYLTLLKKIFENQIKAEEYGLQPPKGFILAGPQGTGKSTIARLTASMLGVPLVLMNVGELFSKWVGESESRLNHALKTIDSMGECVVLIDEADKVMRRSSTEGHEVSARISGMLMDWLARKKSYTPVIFTANYVDFIDVEFRRSGRVNNIFYTWFPTQKEREEIWSIHLKKTGRDPSEYDVELLARKTKMFTGAEIENALQITLMKKFPEEITTQDILNSLSAVSPIYFSNKEMFERMYERLKEFTPVSSEKEVEETALI